MTGETDFVLKLLIVAGAAVVVAAVGLNLYHHANRPVVWRSVGHEPKPEHDGEWRCLRIKHMRMTECVAVSPEEDARLTRLNVVAVLFAVSTVALVAYRSHRRKRQRRGPWDTPPPG